MYKEVRAVTIDVCELFTYLGTIFTLDGKVETLLKLHAENKQAHVMKFISFASKHVDFPFWVKNLFLMPLCSRLYCMAVSPGWDLA